MFFHQLILGSISLSLINMLNGDWIVPWSVTLEVNYINRTRALMTKVVQRTLSEGNTLTDYFTNLAFNFEGTFECKQFHYIQVEGRRIINTDKHGIPRIRIIKSC